MKRILTFALALAFTFGASAQKTVSLKGADETVRLWDNSTAKYSNHETRDEEWYKKNTRIRYTSSCELYIFKAAPEKNSGVAVAIFPGGGFTSVGMSKTLAKWYASVENAGFDSFKVIAATFFDHETEILNFFDNRSTNASAESFNCKIKTFRAQLRGVSDVNYFLFRLQNIYA